MVGPASRLLPVVPPLIDSSRQTIHADDMDALVALRIDAPPEQATCAVIHTAVLDARYGQHVWRCKAFAAVQAHN
jgi:hypothetical protein